MQVVVKVAVCLPEDLAENGRLDQYRGAHVEAESIFFQNGRLAAKPGVLLKHFDGVAACRQRCRSGQPC